MEPDGAPVALRRKGKKGLESLAAGGRMHSASAERVAFGRYAATLGLVMGDAINNLKTLCRAAAVMLLGGALVFAVASGAMSSTIGAGPTAVTALGAPASGEAAEDMVAARTELTSPARDPSIPVAFSRPAVFSSVVSHCSWISEQTAIRSASMLDDSAVTLSDKGSSAFCQGTFEQQFG